MSDFTFDFLPTAVDGTVSATNTDQPGGADTAGGFLFDAWDAPTATSGGGVGEEGGAVVAAGAGDADAVDAEAFAAFDFGDASWGAIHASATAADPSPDAVAATDGTAVGAEVGLGGDADHDGGFSFNWGGADEQQPEQPVAAAEYSATGVAVPTSGDVNPAPSAIVESPPVETTATTATTAPAPSAAGAAQIRAGNITKESMPPPSPRPARGSGIVSPATVQQQQFASLKTSAGSSVAEAPVPPQAAPAAVHTKSSRSASRQPPQQQPRTASSVSVPRSASVPAAPPASEAHRAFAAQRSRRLSAKHVDDFIRDAVSLLPPQQSAAGGAAHNAECGSAAADAPSERGMQSDVAFAKASTALKRQGETNREAVRSATADLVVSVVNVFDTVAPSEALHVVLSEDVSLLGPESRGVLARGPRVMPLFEMEGLLARVLAETMEAQPAFASPSGGSAVVLA